MNKRKTFSFIALALGFTAWFGLLLPWDRLPDPDAFYHAKMAALTWQNGAQTQFPWLDLTALGAHFADQHYFFHVLQSPFVELWGLYNGSRISSLLFAVLAMLAASLVFYKLRLKPFWAWPALLAITDPVCTRLVLGKASPLAIGVFFVAIGAMLFDGEALDTANPNQRAKTVVKNPVLTVLRGPKFWILLVCGSVFALLHGGWIMLIASVSLLVLGQILFDITLNGLGFKRALANAPWSNLLATVLGVGLGLLAHPGRAQLFQTLWIQVVKIGILTPGNLVMGQEWKAADLGAGVGVFSVFGVILLLCVVGLLFADRQPAAASVQNHHDRAMDPTSPIDVAGQRFVPKADGIGVKGMAFMRLAVILGPLLAALFALTVKSIRFAEYFQPVLALWTAALAQLVDWRTIFDKFSFNTPADVASKSASAANANSGFRGLATRTKFLVNQFLLPSVVVIASSVIIFNHVWTAYTSLHGSQMFLDNQYRQPMQAIAQQAKPGDRIYHASWDEFPALFALDSDLRYVSGLDPTFLYEASSTLALDYQKLAFNATSATQAGAWMFIHDRLDAKFVLLDDKRWQDLANLIQKDSRYQLIGQGDGARAYKVTDGQ